MNYNSPQCQPKMFSFSQPKNRNLPKTPKCTEDFNQNIVKFPKVVDSFIKHHNHLKNEPTYITEKKFELDSDFNLRLINHFYKVVDFNFSPKLEQDDIFENTLRCYIEYPEEKSIEEYISTWEKLIDSANKFLSENEDLQDYEKINVILV